MLSPWLSSREETARKLQIADGAVPHVTWLSGLASSPPPLAPGSNSNQPLSGSQSVLARD